jgi:hypothetical protein
MFDSSKVKVLFTTTDRGEVMAKRKGVTREVGSEGSANQRREPMNKNRMKRPTVRDERATDREVHI